MKKLLLLSASALLSLSAMAQVSEPTVKQVWKSDNTVAIPAAADARYGTGFNEKIYVNDKTNTTLYCYSYDETTEKVTRSVVSGVAVAAHAATVDGAGNVILPQSFGTAAAMSGGFVVYNPTTGVSNKISVTLPSDYAAGRADYIGRASGDVFSAEGGSLFLIGQYNDAKDTRILKVTIKNGTEATTEATVDTKIEWSTATIVVPLTNDPTSNEVIIRGRNTGTSSFTYRDNETWTEYKTIGSMSTTAGGDVVKLNDILYTIEPAKYGDSSTYLDGWQIVDRASNEVVYEHKEETDIRSNSGYSTALFAQKISDTKANIYHYHPGAYVAMYTFEVPSVATAIESVAVDANAPVEYYNLQGVKVANPENGLFIKKQGNKATKVIL